TRRTRAARSPPSRPGAGWVPDTGFLRTVATRSLVREASATAVRAPAPHREETPPRVVAHGRRRREGGRHDGHRTGGAAGGRGGRGGRGPGRPVGGLAPAPPGPGAGHRRGGPGPGARPRRGLAVPL